MITIETDNCGYGKTRIVFLGYACLQQVTSYLVGRSNNPKFDKPYCGDFETTFQFLLREFETTDKVKIQFCMGGGSIPEYETVTIERMFEEIQP